MLNGMSKDTHTRRTVSITIRPKFGAWIDSIKESRRLQQPKQEPWSDTDVINLLVSIGSEKATDLYKVKLAPMFWE